MVSDARWNGASLTASRRIMIEILKGELGFKGFVSTDWNAATDSGGGIVNTINAGVDMLMQPADWKGAINTIAGRRARRAGQRRRPTDPARPNASKVSSSWRRDPRSSPRLAPPLTARSGDGRCVSRWSLLQNNNSALPLAKTARVWVGRQRRQQPSNQCGGWTITWQGNGNLTQGTTISQALAKVTTVRQT